MLKTTYKIEKREDIVNENEILLNHQKYGIGVWISSCCDASVNCSVTEKKIAIGDACFRPSTGIPYKKDRLSVEGMNILISKFKRRDIYQRSKLEKKELVEKM